MTYDFMHLIQIIYLRFIVLKYCQLCFIHQFNNIYLSPQKKKSKVVSYHLREQGQLGTVVR